MRAPNVALLLETAERVSDGLGGYAIRWVPVGRLYGAMRAGAGRSGLAEVGAERRRR